MCSMFRVAQDLLVLVALFTVSIDRERKGKTSVSIGLTICPTQECCNKLQYLEFLRV